MKTIKNIILITFLLIILAAAAFIVAKNPISLVFAVAFVGLSAGSVKELITFKK